MATFKVIALDEHGYYRAVLYSYLDPDTKEFGYYIGVGACGCLYDTIFDGFETLKSAEQFLKDFVEEECGVDYIGDA